MRLSLLLAWFASFYCCVFFPRLAASSTQQLNESGDIESKNNTTNKELRIIGGTDATEDRYIYTVSLQTGYPYCGGSLILKDIILTAAHCLDGRSNIEVVIGRHDLNDNDGERVSVKETVSHPLYNNANGSHDIAILILASPVKDDKIQPIALNNDNSYPKPGKSAQVVGWGDTDPGSAVVNAKQLQIVNLDVISNEECETITVGGVNYEGQIDDSMLCTFTEGKDKCKGDSGKSDT